MEAENKTIGTEKKIVEAENRIKNLLYAHTGKAFVAIAEPDMNGVRVAHKRTSHPQEGSYGKGMSTWYVGIVPVPERISNDGGCIHMTTKGMYFTFNGERQRGFSVIDDTVLYNGATADGFAFPGDSAWIAPNIIKTHRNKEEYAALKGNIDVTKGDFFLTCNPNEAAALLADPWLYRALVIANGGERSKLLANPEHMKLMNGNETQGALALEAILQQIK